MNEFGDVCKFNEKFGMIVGDVPGHLTKRKLMERVGHLVEELQEFVEAAGLVVVVGNCTLKTAEVLQNSKRQDLAGQADALVDLVYIAIGTAVMLGLPWQELWDDVHRANMAKVRGVKPTRQYAVDVIKPPGWTGPRTLKILEHYGYDYSRWVSTTEVDMMDGEHRQVSGAIDEWRCRDD